MRAGGAHVELDGHHADEREGQQREAQGHVPAQPRDALGEEHQQHGADERDDRDDRQPGKVTQGLHAHLTTRIEPSTSRTPTIMIAA